MSDNEEKPAEGHRTETEILAQALADSNKEANSSNKNTVRVLGTLLAFSVLGNFALAGLNISGKFFGTDINMGGAEGQPAYFPMEELGYFEDDMIPEDHMPMEAEAPPEEWCADMKGVEGVHPADLAWCKELYPHLWE
jgi:hypothetical protein